jgi:hypothetical protein
MSAEPIVVSLSLTHFVCVCKNSCAKQMNDTASVYLTSYDESRKALGTVTKDDGCHGGEDGAGESVLNIALALALDGLRESRRSHRLLTLELMVV